MFKFHCLGGKKIKEETNSNSSIEDETYTNTENQNKQRKNRDRQVNFFTIYTYRNNIFSQCFMGKCVTKSSKKCEYQDTVLSEDDLESKTQVLNTLENDYTNQLSSNSLKADLSNKSLAEKLFELSKHGWYWGPLSQSEANEKLQGEGDGAFLVRDSSCEQYVLTLSFRNHHETFHTHINHIGATFSLASSAYFDTMEDLINHSMSHFLVARRNPIDNNNDIYVKLTQPISRFTQVRPLQYLCRFVIRQYVRADMRQNLPLPQSIRQYIEEAQF